MLDPVKQAGVALLFVVASGYWIARTLHRIWKGEGMTELDLTGKAQSNGHRTVTVDVPTLFDDLSRS